MDESERREARNLFSQIARDYRNALVTLNDTAIDEMPGFVLVAAGFDETITEHWRFDDAGHRDENLFGANAHCKHDWNNYLRSLLTISFPLILWSGMLSSRPRARLMS